MNAPAAGPWPDYELLDFGHGRRLERFGAVVVDRPCPVATHAPRCGKVEWQTASLRYDGNRAGAGTWHGDLGLDQSITVPLAAGEFRLALATTPAGQIGLFPEQWPNWRWLAERVAALAHESSAPPHVVNLFGYTGASTLAAAVAGAEVTHVDASRPMVAAARHNAELSQLADCTIRWIVDDALAYTQRLAKRGTHVDAVVLDPPSYGHGQKGETWRIERDLPRLLAAIAQLSPRVVLASCHTPGIGPAELSAYMSDALVGHCGQPPRSTRLHLTTTAGDRLPCGVAARWVG